MHKFVKNVERFTILRVILAQLKLKRQHILMGKRYDSFALPIYSFTLITNKQFIDYYIIYLYVDSILDTLLLNYTTVLRVPLNSL